MVVEIAVVFAVEPQAGQGALAAVLGECVGQRRLPVTTAVVGAQAAGKIKQAAHAWKGAGAGGQRRQSAVGLAGDDNAITIYPALGAGVSDDGAQVDCLLIAVG